MRKTVVIGASPNPQRFAYRAVMSLNREGHEPIPVGLRSGDINGIPIHTDMPQIDDVDTVSLYVGPQNQLSWYEYIIGLNPKRIVFNPGTENRELEEMAREAGIKTEHGCTLVMLSVGTY